MRNIQLIAASILVLALCACSQESFVGEYNGDVKTIRVIGPEDIAFEGASTRGTEIINGSTLRFSWALGDSLGIFPDKGNQVEFPITSTEGGTSAVFDGGGWALRNKSNYAAYYPFSVWNYHRNNKKILLDYLGQVQDGNGSFAHLSAYDYLASSRVAPENGVVCFEMSRLGAILYIDIVVPEPAVVNSLVISCDEKIFTEKADLDISGEDAAVTPKKMTNTLTLEFKNTATTMANETVRGYMAVYPVDFSDKTVYATLKTDAGQFGAAVQSRVVNKGKAAFLRFSDDFTPQYGEDNGHTYVEMGDGLRWATCNIGANDSQEYGDYFAWGEVEPYYCSLDPLTWKSGKNAGYAWSSYQFMTEGESSLLYIKKYQADDNLTSAIWYNDGAFVGDGLVVLESGDDAASVNWGSTWRMPTKEEWENLLDESKYVWSYTLDPFGVSVIPGYTVPGYLVTSMVQGYEGNQIFLPAAGGFTYTTYTSSATNGGYWSSSLNEASSPFSWALCFGGSAICDGQIHPRCNGISIRPVQSVSSVSVTGIEIAPETLTINIDETSRLTATILPANASNRAVTWTSNDENVATVSSSGVVSGVSNGTATITATTLDGGFTKSCNVTVKETPSVHVPEAVDMGLPSGLKWASCNLGASLPEEFGDYYAWGETEPYYISQNPLIWKDGKDAGYAWPSYKWCMGSENTLTKYCTQSSSYTSPYGYNGFTDGKTTLDPEDDAAHVNLGGNWRLPTDDDCTELRENCTWTWTTQNSVDGVLVTASNGNSIFLPATGNLADTGYNKVGYYVVFWSSSLVPTNPLYARDAYFILSDGVLNRGSGKRFFGFPVRPVWSESESSYIEF